MTNWHREKAIAQDRAALAKRQEARAEKLRQQELLITKIRRIKTATPQLIRAGSLCLCDVADSEVPCWIHEETALQVLWSASLDVPQPLVHATDGAAYFMQWWPFMCKSGTWTSNEKFIAALGLPRRIEYKDDSWGYRLYSSVSQGRPRATGQDLPKAMSRYCRNLAIVSDPSKGMREKSHEMHLAELTKDYQFAVDAVVAKCNSGRWGNTHIAEDFSWFWETIAPQGSGSRQKEIGFSVVLVGQRRGCSWRSDTLPTTPRRAEAHWRWATDKRERRANPAPKKPRKRRW